MYHFLESLIWTTDAKRLVKEKEYADHGLVTFAFGIIIQMMPSAAYLKCSTVLLE